ncbi:hypothetical protein C8J57DRAFT_181639 [Mycena rebaudengoi]|nr:hypothetical protein C8J57DRAFT_181639 [Mycena rebaudengoi]
MYFRAPLHPFSANRSHLAATNMKLPQELIDAVIDNLSISMAQKDRTGHGPRPRMAVPHELVATLKACALSSRSFLARSQRELFTSVTCTSETNTVFRFHELLSRSPHIGAYVKHFSLIGVGDDSLQDYIPAALILPLLPNLTSLRVIPTMHMSQRWDNQPVPFRAALRGATSLRSLRRLSLYNYSFPDAPTLDSILCQATGLKELELSEISFIDDSIRHVDPARLEALVVLDTLKVYHLDTTAIAAAFALVDVTHLRCLKVSSMRVATPIFKANAQTIQQVRGFFPDETSDIWDPDILKGNKSLRSIDVLAINSTMPSILRDFGDFSHLSALTNISLHFSEMLNRSISNAAMWAALDAILAPASDSIEVQIYGVTDADTPPDLALVKSWLPSVAAKISVHLEFGW